MSTKIKSFWEKHGQKILTFLAIGLVALVSFRAGQNNEKAKSVEKISVSLVQPEALNPHQEKVMAVEQSLKRKGVELPEEHVESVKVAADQAGSAQVPQVAGESDARKTSQSEPSDRNECLLVGSKNSDKFHQSTCQWATRIKPENRVCFSSVEEAQAQGYVPAQGCN